MIVVKPHVYQRRVQIMLRPSSRYVLAVDFLSGDSPTCYRITPTSRALLVADKPQNDSPFFPPPPR